MPSGRQRARCREHLLRLSESTLDSESVRREAVAQLQRVIGFNRWCWPLADPDTLLPLSGLAEHDYGPNLPRALELEFGGNDFAAKNVLARRANSATSLSMETGGDLARSPRWDEVMRPVGIGDVAAAACRDALGCSGWIELYRDQNDRAFEDDDLALLADVGRGLAAAVRRASITEHDDAAEASPTGVLVLDRNLRVLTLTAGARAWVDALPAASLFAAWGILPPAVYPVATLSRSVDTEGEAHALERTVDGRWLMIEASPLEGDHDSIAVTLREAMPSDIRRPLSRLRADATRARGRQRAHPRTRHARSR